MSFRAPALICITVVMISCAPSSDLTEQERQGITTRVETAVEAFAQAQRDLNVEEVLSFLSDDFYMYIDGRRANRDSVAAQIRQTLPSLAELHTRYSNVEVTVLGRNGAVASFTFRDSVIDGSGQVMTGGGPTTLAWQRRGDQWLIVYADADHYSPAPEPEGM